MPRTKDPKTQVFRGNSYTEALLKAKKVFGGDFSIVTRRDVREANLFSKLTSGKLGGDNVAVELEVAASLPEPRRTESASAQQAQRAEGNSLLLRSYKKAMEGAEKHSPDAKQLMTAAAKPYVSVGETATGIAAGLADLRKELEKHNRENALLRDEVRTIVTLQARGGVPAVAPNLLDCYRRLTAGDVSEALARELVETMQRERPDIGSGEPGETDSVLLQTVSRRFPAAGSLLLDDANPGATVVAIVGASGVGKTTCLAKLAIHFALTMRKSVGLINEDCRRPGAEGQINNLYRMFGIPVSTAGEPEKIADAAKSMAGRDLIILDTCGRSPRDAAGMERLAEIVQAAGARETHLVLSGVQSERMLRESMARFRPTGFNRVILTKLDECVSFGTLLNIGSDMAEGLSYMTCGPDYMKPIEPADPHVLAELVLGIREIDGGSESLAEAGLS